MHRSLHFRGLFQFLLQSLHSARDHRVISETTQIAVILEELLLSIQGTNQIHRCNFVFCNPNAFLLAVAGLIDLDSLL